MTDTTGGPLKVFISYSRRDSLDFADQLASALEICGFTAILDRHGITGGEEWEQRLGALILEADTVVFVLSPESAVSSVCAWEVEEAHRRSKRILPIVATPLGTARPPERLQKLNYVHFYSEPSIPGSGFGTGLNGLVKALNADLDWLREHTQQTGVATGWEERGRPQSRLLTGSDITDAKAWVANQPKTAPDPTPLHLEFLRASEDAEALRLDEAKRQLEERERLAREREEAAKKAEQSAKAAELAQEDRARAVDAAEQAAKETARTQRRVGRLLVGIGALVLLLLLGTVWQGRETEQRETLVMLSKTADAMNQGLFDRAMRYALPGLPAEGALPYLSPLHTGLEGRLAGAAMQSRLLLHIQDADSASADGKRIVAMFDGKPSVLDGETGKVQTELKCPGFSIEISPDGSKVAGSLSGPTVPVCDAATGQSLYPLVTGGTGFLRRVAFSSDSRYLATVGSAVQVWYLATGQKISVLEGHEGIVSDVSFSLNGERVLTKSDDRTARVWDVATGRLLATWKLKLFGVSSARFSPDGTRVVTATGDDLVLGKSDNSAWIWDSTSAAPVVELKGHEGHVSFADFSPDGRRVVTASADNTARLWDAQTGTLVSTLKGHGDPVSWAAFSPDGRILATASADRTARLWDTETGKELAVLHGHEKYVGKVVFTSDGQRLVTHAADQTARVWDARPAYGFKNLIPSGPPIGAAEFSPDGKFVLAYETFASNVHVFDAQSGKPRATLPPHEHGTRLATFCANGTRAITRTADSLLRVWDTVTWQEVAAIPKKGSGLTSVAINPDGTLLALVYRDGKVTLRSVGSDQEPVLMEGKAGSHGPAGITFSPDGKRVAAVSIAGGQVWDVETRALVAKFDAKNSLGDIAFSPDGRQFLTSYDRDPQMRIWQSDNGRQIAAVRGALGSFTPDGNTVFGSIGDGTVRLWDAATGEERLMVNAGFGNRDTAASADGLRIATTSNDGTVRIWDVRTGEEMARFFTHAGGISSLAFTRDGQELLTSGGDGGIKIWDLSWLSQTGGTLRERVCSEKLKLAQTYSDGELADPILSNSRDATRRNPCLRRGPLSPDYYAQTASQWWNSIVGLFPARREIPAQSKQ